MKQILIKCNKLILVLTLVLTGTWFGAGGAVAAPVPTVAVTTSGATSWQITFDRGRAAAGQRCVVAVAGRSVMSSARAATVLLPGRSVASGVHPVQVRCGKSVSPTVWLHAPRNQVNDVATWLANLSAGFVGA